MDLPDSDVKKLQGNTEDYRLRVGDYRIIFTKDDERLWKFLGVVIWNTL